PIVNKTLNEKKQGKQNYEQSIDDLTKYLTDTVDNEHQFAGITAYPAIPTVPEMSVLSTSVRRARLAAKLGIGYTLGLFPLADENEYNIGMHATRTYQKKT